MDMPAPGPDPPEPDASEPRSDKAKPLVPPAPDVLVDGVKSPTGEASASSSMGYIDPVPKRDDDLLLPLPKTGPNITKTWPRFGGYSEERKKLGMPLTRGKADSRRPTPIWPETWESWDKKEQDRHYHAWVKQMAEEDKLLEAIKAGKYEEPATLAAVSLHKLGVPSLSYLPITEYTKDYAEDDPALHRPLPVHWKNKEGQANIRTILHWEDSAGNPHKWMREDFGKENFLTTLKRGPAWHTVTKRITERLDETHYERILVEWCCGENSKLGQDKNKPRDTRVLRITESHDARLAETTRYAIEEMRKYRDILLWGSIPCTGGSPWQHLNKRKPGGMKRWRAHRQQWRKIWDQFEDAARACHRLGGHVVIEWPSLCDYWREARVQRLVSDLGLEQVKIDGCAVGLKSVDNIPIRKPWTLKTAHEGILKSFAKRRCPGKEKHPSHQSCEGKHTRPTEEYTDYFARLVHGAFQNAPRIPKMSLAAISFHLDNQAADQLWECERSPVPRMPKGPSKQEHRKKDPDVAPIGFASVAKQLTKKEIASSKRAMASVQTEWDKLRKAGAWDESKVREYHHVAQQHRNDGTPVHFGRVFPLCHEKDSEMDLPEDQKLYKGRVVFQGNEVRDQFGDYAIFHEMSSAPATLAAAKMADCYGLFPDNGVEQCDAKQAYIQSRIRGTPTWVFLPETSGRLTGAASTNDLFVLSC